MGRLQLVAMNFEESEKQGQDVFDVIKPDISRGVFGIRDTVTGREILIQVCAKDGADCDHPDLTDDDKPCTGIFIKAKDSDGELRRLMLTHGSLQSIFDTTQDVQVLQEMLRRRLTDDDSDEESEDEQA